MLQETMIPGHGNGLSSAVSIEFEENVVQVLLNRADADEKRLRDLAVGRPIGDQPQHFKLTLAQRFEVFGRARQW